MTIDTKLILRSIDPRPGFLLTCYQMELMQGYVRELVTAYEAQAQQIEDLKGQLPKRVSIADAWPEESESVLIFLNGDVIPAFWQEEQEGDFENGYKKYRQFYYCPDWDKFEPLDAYGCTFDWQAFPKPSAGDLTDYSRALAKTYPWKGTSHRADGNADEFVCIHCGASIVDDPAQSEPEHHTDTCIWAKAVACTKETTMKNRLLDLVDRLAMAWINRRMDQEVAELKKEPGYESIQLRKAEFDENGWSMDMVHRDVAILAASAAEMLTKQNAKNYVQMVMYPKVDMQPVEVTVRWYWGGLTPAQLNSQLQDELDAAKAFHPRAMKLIGKRKNFVVVAEDEPYFPTVYALIRAYEFSNGRWTDEDERIYREAMQKAGVSDVPTV
jgi:hypothetical protein